MAAVKWLLIELFGGKGGKPMSVIGWGRTPKNFVPLDQILRHRTTLAQARDAIADAITGHGRIDRVSADGSRRTIAVPLAISPDRLHGVMLWCGDPRDQVPPRDPAGAWYFNYTEGTSTRSDDLLDLYGITREGRSDIYRHSIADVFTQVHANLTDQSEALARIVREEIGTETQQIWTVRRDDGELRAAHFSCRLLEELSTAGERQVVLRGITHDIGPADDIPAAPPPTILEHRVLEAAAEEGEYRGIVNLRTLRLLRWMGTPAPGIAWQGLTGQPAPAIHPDDLPTATAMATGLRHGRTSGEVRVRTLDGGWTRLHIKAALMMLDESTTAALVTVRLPESAL
ncbi:GAF domain-containing protein [Nocardia sp. CA-129566]|uniref:GAF domain-containing protein n=1 Tax=Nocardia sp. CA-129566 TaxID=3239976 RepID=UPI003D98D986